MTNTSILKADLLDILFEHRNKEYGAYDLRRGYNRRMLAALGAGVVLIGVFILSASLQTKKTVQKPQVAKQEVVIRTIHMPVEKIKEPEKPQQTVKQKPVEKIATIQHTTPVIKKDNEVTKPVAANSEIDGKKIDVVTEAGKEDVQLAVTPVVEPVEPVVPVTQPGPSQPEFIADERDPEFPGGAAGLKQFLARNLDTPGDLENGERKLVRVKFQVNKDGSVSSFEIITSAGDEYDGEVMRVVKKMPRWAPAIQNGISVPVSYVLPVTFIGVE